MSTSHYAAAFLTVVVVVLTGALLADCDEFCQFDVFNASCYDQTTSGSGHVVLVDKARYGRLELGRCVTRDYGFVGCSIDVLPVLDQVCSGRPACRFPVPRLRDLDPQPCPKDLTSYLDASYRCVPVVDLSSMRCNETLQLDDTKPVYISNDVDAGWTLMTSPDEELDVHGISSHSTVAFSPNCPLMIEANRGQTVNLTLYTFSSVAFATRRYCPVHAFITDGARSHGVAMCGFDSQPVPPPASPVHGGPSGATGHVGRRTRHIYESRNRRIGIYFSQRPYGGGGGGGGGGQVAAPGVDQTTTQLQQQSTGRFLLEIKAAGCPDVDPMDGMWTERFDDRLWIVCNRTHVTSYMTCVGNEWTGALNNCSKGRSDLMVASRQTAVEFGVAFAVIVGTIVGVACGLTLLSVVFCHRRSRQFSENSNVNRLLLQPIGDDDVTAHKAFLDFRFSACGGVGDVACIGGTGSGLRDVSSSGTPSSSAQLARTSLIEMTSCRRYRQPVVSGRDVTSGGDYVACATHDEVRLSCVPVSSSWCDHVTPTGVRVIKSRCLTVEQQEKFNNVDHTNGGDLVGSGDENEYCTMDSLLPSTRRDVIAGGVVTSESDGGCGRLVFAALETCHPDLLLESRSHPDLLLESPDALLPTSAM